MSALIDQGEDFVGKLLATGYRRFASESGIEGLYQEDKRCLHLLAVFATQPGRGQFRSFMAAAKKEFQTVCVWEVWNPMLEGTLIRYGFKPETQTLATGEQLQGYRWDK